MNNDELTIDFSEMSDEDVVNFKFELENKYDEIVSDYASKIKELKDSGVDLYSRKGKKQMNAIIDEFAEDDEGYSVLLEETLRELKLRQIDESKYAINPSERISDEEYVLQQLKKSDEFRKD